jgi:spore photoproduct lyase
MLENSQTHFEKACENTAFQSLHVRTQQFLENKATAYRLSFSQIQQLIVIAVDLQMWGEDIEAFWVDKEHKKEALSTLLDHYETLKTTLKIYPAIENFCLAEASFSDQASSVGARALPEQRDKNTLQKEMFKIEEVAKEHLGLGSCPVASPKTRCCNLLTLDAVESCGFDCSYCSIQSFYKNNTVTFDKNFAQKLERLELAPAKTYHIGTGQSSDSLMWGNRAGVLEALFAFAHKHPNVILELKSKSDNITYLLENDVPKNVICTWSLNPQVIIDNEEKRASSLEARVQSARALADKGVLVGFHFHPIVLFEGWQEAYTSIAHKLTHTFTCKEIALVSMGTLTFIKPVLKKIRLRAQKSKILQMPLVDASGKYSYPLALKEEMFSTLYQAFEPWHGEVFFYLCMEDESLWQKVFGYEFENNFVFETAMMRAYQAKINA